MKNKILKKLTSVINQTCIIFTCIVFAFHIMGTLLQATGQMSLQMLFLLFLASLWFSFTDEILLNKKLNIFLRVSLHFISSTVGFYIIFIYLTGYGKSASSSQPFLLVVLFAVAYLTIAAIVLFIRSLILKKKNATEEYTDIYNKEK